MKNIFFMLLAGFLISLSACTSDTNQSETTDTPTNEEATTETTSALTLTPMGESPSFPDSKIEAVNVSDGDILEAGEQIIEFDVAGYSLAEQTADAEGKGIANSGKGQHIHVILNNEPYMAHYDPEVELNLEDGAYLMCAFLSRSYHESVKSEGASLVRQFFVGESAVKEQDVSGPMVFYSRPKGTYKGEDTKKVMLDFYLVNTDLTDGNQVRATINGTEFMVKEWAPMIIEGLPMGENTVKLELLDADMKLISAPFNPVERTFTLAE